MLTNDNNLVINIQLIFLLVLVIHIGIYYDGGS